jgi:hypothetical protein
VAARVLLDKQQDPRYSKARLDRVTTQTDGSSNSSSGGGQPKHASVALLLADRDHSHEAVAVPLADDGIAQPSQGLSKWKATAGPLTAFNGFPGEKEALMPSFAPLPGAFGSGGATATAMLRSSVPSSLRMYLPVSNGVLRGGQSSMQALFGGGSALGNAPPSPALIGNPPINYQQASRLMTTFKITVHTANEVMEALRWGIDKTAADADMEGEGGGDAGSGSSSKKHQLHHQRRDIASGRSPTNRSARVHWGKDKEKEKEDGSPEPGTRPPSTPTARSALAASAGGRPRSAVSTSSRANSARSGRSAGSGGGSSGLIISSGDALQLNLQLQKLLSKGPERRKDLVPGVNFMPREALANPLGYRFSSSTSKRKPSAARIDSGRTGTSSTRRLSAAGSTARAVGIESSDESDGDDKHSASKRKQLVVATDGGSSGSGSSIRPGPLVLSPDACSKKAKDKAKAKSKAVELGHLAVISLSIDVGHLQCVKVVVPPDVVTSASAATAAALVPSSSSSLALSSAPSPSSLSSPSAASIRNNNDEGTGEPTLNSARSNFTAVTTTSQSKRAASSASQRAATPTRAVTGKEGSTARPTLTRRTTGLISTRRTSIGSTGRPTTTRDAAGEKAHEEDGAAAYSSAPSQAPLFEVVVAPDLEPGPTGSTALRPTSSSSSSLAFPSDSVMYGMALVKQRTLNWSGADAFEKRHSRRFLDLDLSSNGKSSGSSGDGSTGGSRKGNGAFDLKKNENGQYQERLDGDHEGDDDDDDDDDSQLHLGVDADEDAEARLKLLAWKREKRRQIALEAEYREKRKKENRWSDFLRGYRDLKGRPKSAPASSRGGAGAGMSSLVAPTSPTSIGGRRSPSLGATTSRRPAATRHAHSASATAALAFVDELGIPKEVIRATGRRGGGGMTGGGHDDGAEGAGEKPKKERTHTLFQRPVIRASGMWRLWLVAPSLAILNQQANNSLLMAAPAAALDTKPSVAASAGEGAQVAGSSEKTEDEEDRVSTPLISARSRNSTGRNITSARGIEVSRVVTDRKRALAAAAALGRPSLAMTIRSLIDEKRDKQQKDKQHKKGKKGSKWTLENPRKEKEEKKPAAVVVSVAATRPTVVIKSASTSSLWPAKQPVPVLGQHGVGALGASALVSPSSSAVLPPRAVPPLPTQLVASASTSALLKAVPATASRRSPTNDRRAQHRRTASPAKPPLTSSSAGTVVAASGGTANTGAAASSASFAVVQDRARRQLLLQGSPQHESLYASIKALASPKPGMMRGVKSLSALRVDDGDDADEDVPRGLLPLPAVATSEIGSMAKAQQYYGESSGTTPFTPMAASLARKSLLSPIHAMVAARKTPKVGRSMTFPTVESADGEDSSDAPKTSTVRFEEEGEGRSTSPGRKDDRSSVSNKQKQPQQQLPLRPGSPGGAFSSPSATAASLLAETLNAFAPVPSNPGTDPRALGLSPDGTQRGATEGGEGEGEADEEEDVVHLGQLVFQKRASGSRPKAFPYKSGPLTPRRVLLSPIGPSSHGHQQTSNKTTARTGRTARQQQEIETADPPAENEQQQQQPEAAALALPPPPPEYSQSLKHLCSLILASDRMRERLRRKREREVRRRRREEEKGRIILRLTGHHGALSAGGSIASGSDDNNRDDTGSKTGKDETPAVSSRQHKIFSFLLPEEHQNEREEESSDEEDVSQGNDEDGDGQDAFKVVATRVLASLPSMMMQPASPLATSYGAQIDGIPLPPPVFPPPDKLPYCERKAKKTLDDLRSLIHWWRKRCLLWASMEWDLTLRGHQKVLASIVKKKAAITGGFDNDKNDEETKALLAEDPNGSKRAAVLPLTPSAGAKGLISVITASAKVNRKAAEQLIVQADAGKIQFVKLVNSTRGNGPSKTITTGMTTPTGAAVTTTLVNRGPRMTVDVLGAPPSGSLKNRAVASAGTPGGGSNSNGGTSGIVIGFDDVVAMVLPKTRGSVTTPRIKPYPHSVGSTPLGSSSSAAAVMTPIVNGATGDAPFWAIPTANSSSSLAAAALVVNNAAEIDDDPISIKHRRKLTEDIEDGLMRSSSDASLRPRRPLSGLTLAVKIDQYSRMGSAERKRKRLQSPFTIAANELKSSLFPTAAAVSAWKTGAAAGANAVAATPDPKPRSRSASSQSSGSADLHKPSAPSSPTMRYQQQAYAASASMPSLPLLEESPILEAWKPGKYSVTPTVAGTKKKGSLLDFILEEEEKKRQNMMTTIPTLTKAPGGRGTTKKGKTAST